MLDFDDNSVVGRLVSVLIDIGVDILVYLECGLISRVSGCVVCVSILYWLLGFVLKINLMWVVLFWIFCIMVLVELLCILNVIVG